MTTTRPNILLFLTDDHGAWANGCYGNGEILTPTLDALAARGVRCANAFTPTPVCSPARAALLTGRTASQIGIHDWIQDQEPSMADRDWLDGTPTLFDLLHDAGYVTALCGKWHVGRSHRRPSSCDYHFGLPFGQGAHNVPYTYLHNDEFVRLEGNKSAHITDHALDFLNSLDSPDAPGNGQPFFLNVGYVVTHAPYGQQHHDPAVTGLYQDATFADIPPFNSHPWAKNEDGPGDSPPLQALRDRYIGYYAAVTEIDRNVARILARLDELGRLENTVVIYTSDHGCTLGHHGFWGKGNSTRPLNMYETSLRVPLIWAGPGVAAGVTLDDCVDHYDTFSTLLELAGATLAADASQPGRSYGPGLQGRDMDWDDLLIGEYGDLRMARTPAWKLVWRYPDGPHDLFDLANDPGETVNLAADPAYADRVALLKGEIDRFYADYDDPAKSGLRVKALPQHNVDAEAWRDGRREARGLQRYDLPSDGS